MSCQSKYHPVQPCAKCGRTRRVMARGMCCSCYIETRDEEDPGYLERRREFQRNYMRTYERQTTAEEYISPMKAIRILVAAFSREGVAIDDVCSYIAMCRKLYSKGGTEPNKTTHRKWGATCRAS